MKKGYINKLLFDKRVARGYDRKTASKLLGISLLKLKLIECGYIGVNQKYYQRFIDTYQLSPKFFSENSDYTQDLIIQNKSIFDASSKRFYAHKAVKWTGLALTCASAIGVGYGVYSLEKDKIYPRDAWSDEYVNFNAQMKKKGTKSWSLVYLDDVYRIEDDYPVTEVGNIATYINTYGKDVNAVDTNFQANIDSYQGKESAETPHLVRGSKLSFDFGVYNRRRLLYCSWSNPNKPDISISNALISIDEDGNYYLLPFQYYDVNKEIQWARYNTPIYNEFSKIFPNIAQYCFKNLDDILVEKQLGYTKVKNLINDLQVISRDQVFHNRVGIGVTAACTAATILFAIMMGLGFYYYRVRKKKTYIVEETVEQQIEYNNKMFMWKGRKINDVKFGPFLPEWVLKVAGVICLLLFSIAMYLFITKFLVSEKFEQINNFRIAGANLMQGAVVLLFFVKMDILAKKNNGSTVFSILILFLGGVTLYVAELCTFKILGNNQSIIGVLMNIFNGLIPGNIFFTLGWYSLIYFLLFNNPKATENNRKARIAFRSCSSIPTFFLIFNMFWQFLIKSKVNASHYVNLLFFSKGVLLTLFVIVYLYSLFVYQQICRKKFGNKLCNDIYFNSRRYLLTKNGIASIILLILLIIDIVVGIYMPRNQLKLGKNWAVGLIIPLIMFYHPNIDKRVVWWDKLFPAINFFCMAGGYLAIIARVLAYVNVGEFIYIVW